MKKSFISSFVILALFLIVLPSCNEEKSTPPVITFWTGSAYVSGDTTMLHGSVFNVGIDAQKTGVEGLLSGLSISKQTDGGNDSVILSSSFISQSFSQFYSYNAPDSGVTDKYTFYVSKADGLSNSISLSVTGN